ncbi:MAG: Gfo/Idh/MocA family oxidoreductase [Nitrososphaerota archaeon]|nr:Gfo/Idh/MocA family oxidoreductase [Nitrososphaerota archaeon]MDG6935582.1 Gfo/Idh/MocA family oxidoreductase [Nitrososphaerota archaeon]MDG6944026.1 Gfo/Idh/MocA family oxidoreductase [Nitrososphaerota archaeon]
MTGGILGVGLIGLGEISLIHEAGYNDDQRVKITAVCDLDSSLARSRAEPYGARHYTDYSELISDSGVDMVDIALPHRLHYKAAKEALLAGKHVLVEKPMAMKYREAADLIATARAKGVKFTVAENTRHVELYQRAVSIIQDGRIGRVWNVRTMIAGSEITRYSDRRSWVGSKRLGGGIVIDAGVHTFYLFKWAFGGVKYLRAYNWHQLGTDAEDNSVVIGRLRNGAAFQSQFSDSAQLPWTERLEVYGDKGVLVGDQLSNPPLKIYAGPMDEDGEAVSGVEYDPMGWKLKSIMNEVKDFADAVIEKRDPLVNPYDGAYAVKVAEMVYAGSLELDQIE